MEVDLVEPYILHIVCALNEHQYSNLIIFSEKNLGALGRCKFSYSSKRMRGISKSQGCNFAERDRSGDFRSEVSGSISD